MDVLPPASVQTVVPAQSAVIAAASSAGLAHDNGSATSDSPADASTAKVPPNFAALLAKTDVTTQAVPIKTNVQTESDTFAQTKPQSAQAIFNLSEPGAFNARLAVNDTPPEKPVITNVELKTTATDANMPKDATEIGATLSKLLVLSLAPAQVPTQAIKTSGTNSAAPANVKTAALSKDIKSAKIEHGPASDRPDLTLSAAFALPVADGKNSIQPVAVNSIIAVDTKTELNGTLKPANSVSQGQPAPFKTQSASSAPMPALIQKPDQAPSSAQPTATAAVFEGLLNADAKVNAHSATATPQTLQALIIPTVTATHISTAPVVIHTPESVVVHANTLAHSVGLEIVKATQSGKTEFIVRLDPAELGRIEIKLHVDHDGKVQAILSSDNPQTHDMLRREAGTLERALTDSGLKTDNSSLSFNLRDQNAQHQGSAYSRSNSNQILNAPKDTDTVSFKTITGSLTQFLSDSRIDMMA